MTNKLNKNQMEQQKSKHSLRICKNCDKSRLVYKDNLCFGCYALQKQNQEKEDEEVFLDISNDIIKSKKEVEKQWEKK